MVTAQITGVAAALEEAGAEDRAPNLQLEGLQRRTICSRFFLSFLLQLTELGMQVES